MIKEPTVLVFGAGVSKPYGFPLGEELRNIIIQESSQWYETFDLEGITKSKVDEFIDSFRDSHLFSIDAFLERQPEFIKAGKIAIALSLLPLEDLSSLLNTEPRFYNDDFHTRVPDGGGIYRYLLNKLVAGASWDDFPENKIGIITFNYDRSLEQYLFTTLKATYMKSDEDCAILISKIPIIHVHGSLGPLPWQSPKGKEYNEQCTPRNIREAAQQIVVIPDGKHNSDEFQKAFNMLQKAEKTYFLGFSYQLENLQKLRLRELPQIKKAIRSEYLWKFLSRSVERWELSGISGSALNMQNAEIKSIQSNWCMNLPDNTCDALLFLRKHANLG